MSTTLTYGLIKPVTGDKGSVWFPAIESDITQLDAHDHNGTNSAQLGNAAILSAAAIERSKIKSEGGNYRILANTSAGAMGVNAALTAAHVVYADANGQLAGEATLAITRGGTGQATATLGFNALSPVTTTGDLIYRDATNNIRLGIGSAGQVLTVSGGIPSWQTNTTLKDSSDELSNLTLTASVAANALTVAMKTKAGTDPAGGDIVYLGFRSATAATGTYVQRSVTAALSVVVSSGSTLGHTSAVQQHIYVYAIDNAGTVELAVSSTKFDEGTRISTTAEGGVGAADSLSVMYSTTGRSNVACRLIGRLSSTQSTAGTWATAIAEISLQPFESFSGLSELVLDTGNGHGNAGGTMVRRFTTIQKSSGSGIDYTYADSVGNGMSITINKAGLWAFSYSDVRSAGAGVMGISRNASSTTVSLSSITATGVLAYTNNPAANVPGFCSTVLRCEIGDTIRAHTGGNMDGTGDTVRFSAVYLG